MVSIDKVYQKVLAFANKEQRGYITPQEFNLFADQAQMEIFEQYFYDINQFGRVPGNINQYADMLTNLEEKINIFERYDRPVNVSSTTSNPNFDSWGDIIFGNYAPDLYRLGMVRVRYKTEPQYREVEEIKLSELMTYNNTPLTKSSKKRPYYIRYPTSSGLDRIKIYPYPSSNNAIDRVRISYTRKPLKPNWGYVVVSDKPLYNSDTSTNFELHLSEEPELVYRILTFAGIAMEKPQLAQMAGGLGGAQIQQEKQ